MRREQRGGSPAEATAHIPEQPTNTSDQPAERRATGAVEQPASRRSAVAPEHPSGQRATEALEQTTGRHADGALEQATARGAAGALEQTTGRHADGALEQATARGAAGALEQAAGRRAAGALESAILGVLWSAQGALSPGEVREALARTDAEGSALSYSTVVTILTRLHEKGSLSRERDGRAYRYAPVADEAGLAARRLSQLLDRSADREAVLSRFVADLSARDEELLRSLLGGEDSAADDDGARVTDLRADLGRTGHSRTELDGASRERR